MAGDFGETSFLTVLRRMLVLKLCIGAVIARSRSSHRTSPARFRMVVFPEASEVERGKKDLVFFIFRFFFFREQRVRGRTS